MTQNLQPNHAAQVVLVDRRELRRRLGVPTEWFKRFEEAGLLQRTSWIGTRRNWFWLFAHPDVFAALEWARGLEILRTESRSTTVREVLQQFPHLRREAIRALREKEKQ